MTPEDKEKEENLEKFDGEFDESKRDECTMVFC